MGLFSSKKKEELKAPPVSPMNLKLVQPQLKSPSFPEVPIQKVPVYEPTLKDIKKEVQAQPMEKPAVSEMEEPMDIPMRTPRMAVQPRVIPRVEEEFKPDFSEEFVPTTNMTMNQQAVMSEKPLFIKIENYKIAINEIHSLRDKIHAAENVLNSLEDLRRKEEREIQNWKSELNKLKSKLLIIDKNLFGG